MTDKKKILFCGKNNSIETSLVFSIENSKIEDCISKIQKLFKSIDGIDNESIFANSFMTKLTSYDEDFSTCFEVFICYPEEYYKSNRSIVESKMKIKTKDENLQKAFDYHNYRLNCQRKTYNIDKNHFIVYINFEIKNVYDMNFLNNGFIPINKIIEIEKQDDQEYLFSIVKFTNQFLKNEKIIFSSTYVSKTFNSKENSKEIGSYSRYINGTGINCYKIGTIFHDDFVELFYICNNKFLSLNTIESIYDFYPNVNVLDLFNDKEDIIIKI